MDAVPLDRASGELGGFIRVRRCKFSVYNKMILAASGVRDQDR